jgi:hypothetical protein
VSRRCSQKIYHQTPLEEVYCRHNCFTDCSPGRVLVICKAPFLLWWGVPWLFAVCKAAAIKCNFPTYIAGNWFDSSTNTLHASVIASYKFLHLFNLLLGMLALRVKDCVPLLEWLLMTCQRVSATQLTIIMVWLVLKVVGTAPFGQLLLKSWPPDWSRFLLLSQNQKIWPFLKSKFLGVQGYPFLVQKSIHLFSGKSCPLWNGMIGFVRCQPPIHRNFLWNYRRSNITLKCFLALYLPKGVINVVRWRSCIWGH